MTRPPLLVFSDLDGTLLDHQSYDWAPAQPALTLLSRIGAVVVLASSKTAAEIAPLRTAMALGPVPAIIENGAGLLPADASSIPGHDYAKLTTILSTLDPHFQAQFEGFHRWSVDQIAQETGLPPDQAARAANRQFSVPGLWRGDPSGLDQFLAVLSGLGVAARQGGRFLTLSFGATKADQMNRIAASYGTPITMALGDAANDVEMLEQADYGALIVNPHGQPLPALAGEQTGRIRRSQLAGPHGWNEMIHLLVDELKLS
ncbi:mannosyl-3-phosphoglycerate phosphatase [Actibacterium sp. 188UL27-1]|uniref:HAD-IIB family hydrolase n=1 Tax=Actibacterium sp. 188UL27-1 TaxID=2786961 RepID=UPI0019576FE4|nr:HAD-IIB family hydrolase [Actibacterium sp. 188UL27-1]MBM7068788.1 HAD-IIB family hydrolase [Actibacterium sp. 188UL27-1]